jgi:serine/threonine protein kinase/Tol biopolymer transport system component
MIGETVHDRYRILDQIGEDYLAISYLARDQTRNEVVVLKLIRPKVAAGGEFLKCFRDEAEKLKRLTLPQAVSVLDYGEAEAGAYVVFEYVGGKTLAELCQREGALPLEQALDVAYQVGLYLMGIHAHGLVHCDLRPADILLTGDGMVKVMDSGLAPSVGLGRLLGSGELERDEYHAPELAAGAEVDSRTDLYSLGAVLFEMLSGKRPATIAASPEDLSNAHLRPSRLRPDVPPEADDLVAHCLALDPRDRPQSAAEFLEGVDETVRGMATRAQSAALGMEDALAGHALGPYRMIEKLGRGGMATVYKAYESSLDRYVAIKVLPQYFAHDPQFLTRFRREAKAVARLNHPGIVPIYGFGEEGELTYIVMRYVEGGTLKDLLGRPMALERATRIVLQVAQALDYAHQQGVVHRDVKPANVLMAEGDWPLLSDFGLARMIASSVQLTQTGVGVGTPAYMSPEQGQGLKVDRRSDIYSLGIMFYEMLTGEVPFQADTPMAVVLKHITAPLPTPRQVNPNIPESIERVILKATAKDPAYRYQSMRELVEGLQKALAGLPVEVSPLPGQPLVAATQPTTLDGSAISTATEVLPFPERKRRIPAWALGLVGVLVIVGLIAGAVASGLIPLARETSLATEVIPEKAVSRPAVGVTPAPTKLVSPGAPPIDARQVRPCEGEGLGSGLCISSLRGGQPVQILKDVKFKSIGRASWSPNGEQIAFSAIKPGGDPSRDNALYIVNADGSGLTELPSIGNDISPAWSPDGRWLAFHSNCDLAIMHPDGSAPTVIWYSESGICTFDPEWSPDNESIVVSMQIGGGGTWTFPMTREVWVLSRDGTTITPVATITHKDESCVRIEVALSPDGTQVAYIDADCQPRIVSADGSGQAAPLKEFPYWWTSAIRPQWGGERRGPPPLTLPAQPGEGKIVEQCENATPPQICIRDAKTGRVTQVTSNLDFGQIVGCTWSPDGQQIMCDLGSDPATTQRYDHKLYVINADGSGLRQVTSGVDTNDLMPAWSPDGQWIAFHRNCDLWLTRPDGSDERMLLSRSDRFCAVAMVWSPNSQRIAFLNKSEGAPNHEVWVVNRDGTDPQVVHSFERPLEPHEVAWSPDGRRVACWLGDGGELKALLINADGSGEPQVIEGDRIPWFWLPNFWPQWGGRR